MRLADIILLEYINYDTDKFMKKWSAEGKPYEDNIKPDGQNFTNWLESHEPSPKNKFVNWMIIRYLKNDIKRLEDIPARISPALRKYMGLQNKKKLKPEHTDINRIQNLEDVMDEYSESSESKRDEAKSIEKSMYDSGDAELIYNDKEYKVVIPKTHKAQCFFGKNTRWCTTAKDNPSMHDYYSEDGPLYIILHKPTNTRWQFHFESRQYMDEIDEEINIIEFFKSHKKIFGVFKKLGYVDYSPNQWKLGNSYYNDKMQLHREDGPAVIDADGYQAWWINGKRHREDGPAIIHADGTQEWYLNHKDVTVEVNEWFKEYKLTYETMDEEEKMIFGFHIRSLMK